LPPHSQVALNPRKLPIQARSVASVDAILEATIQVLLQVGKERLTTTRVAERAGVSVGTLYQYFPNKGALLQAVLRRHLDGVSDAIELVCMQQNGEPLRPMITALITTFLQAKMRNGKTSVALYSVSSDVDGQKIAQQSGLRANKAIVRMLTTSSESLTTDSQIVASLIQGMMAGVSRRILESAAPEKHLEDLRNELLVAACSYIDACIPPVSLRHSKTRTTVPNAITKQSLRRTRATLHESITIH
jgi:AcrR family transcriptional regulator